MQHQEHKLTRRRFLQWSGGGIGMMALAACAPVPSAPSDASAGEAAGETVGETASAPSSEGPIYIRFAAHGDWGWLTVWSALIEKFNEEHEGEISVSFEHSTGDIWAKYMTQMVAGTAADVIRWEDKRAPEWMHRGQQLLDLTPYYEADDSIKPEDYFEVLWTDCWWEGKLVQLPHDCSPVTLWYNPTIFEERGVALPPKTWDDPSWTWEQFLDTCLQVTHGEGPEKVFGVLSSRWWLYTHPWVWSNGGEIITYPDNEVKLDMPETIEAWEFIASWSNEHGIQPTPDQATEGASALFESGRVAFNIDNGSYSQRAVLVAEEQGFTWDFAPIPSHNGKPVFTRCPNNTIACYARTPHPEAAYTFAAFMSSDEAMMNTRAVPSRIAVATGPYLQRTEQHNWQLQVESLTEHLKIEPRTPYFEAANRALDDAWHSVLDGVVDAQTAINDVIPTLEEILAGNA